MSLDIAETLLNEDAVLWARTDQQTDNGQWVFDAPVQIKCHWEYKTGIATNAAGDEVQFLSIVYVDRKVLEDSILFEGTLDDLTDPDNPKNNKDVVYVQAGGHVTSLDGDETLYIAYC